MLSHDELDREMIGIAGRYSKLKTHFQNFCDLAKGALTAKSSTVKGVTFGTHIEDNYFEVFFAGHRVRFSLFMDKSGCGVIEVHKRDLLSGDCREKVGSVTFDEQGEICLKGLEREGDIIRFSDNAPAARIVVLHFVHEAISVEIIPYIKSRGAH